jgi:hypothetical protein
MPSNGEKAPGEDILNFVIAIVALIIAVMAFQRTGGTKDLRKTTAELLAKMEKRRFCSHWWSNCGGFGLTKAGGDLFMTIKSTIYGIVKAGSDVGADVAKTAVAATEGAIKAAAKAGPDIREATKAYTQDQMQAFREETETIHSEYKKVIDQLQATAEKLGGDAKAKAEQQLTA